jgi:hypothetical protein
MLQKQDPREEAESFEEEFEGFSLPERYHGHNPDHIHLISQEIDDKGKVHRIYASGRKEIVYKNGTRKEIFPDGYRITWFLNNDI